MSIKHQLVIVWVLLVAYTAPILVAAAVVLGHPLSAPDVTSGFLKWLSTFAMDSESQLNLFHKIILPVVAGISALTFSNPGVAVAANNQQIAHDPKIELIIFSIAIICICIIVVVSIDMAPPDPDKTAVAAVANIKKYISNVSEYMGVYLMVLLGLKSQ